MDLLRATGLVAADGRDTSDSSTVVGVSMRKFDPRYDTPTNNNTKTGKSKRVAKGSDSGVVVDGSNIDNSTTNYTKLED